MLTAFGNPASARAFPRARCPATIPLHFFWKEHPMATSTADAVWEGGLKDGKGSIKTGSGAINGAYSFKTRFEGAQGAAGTNPEELIGAAHAGCFSMALSAGLGKGGFTPTRIKTSAKVHLEKVGEGFKITRIQLTT